MGMFYFTLDTEMIESKTTGEPAADDCQPVSQGIHFSIGVGCAITDVKLT